MQTRSNIITRRLSSDSDTSTTTTCDPILLPFGSDRSINTTCNPIHLPSPPSHQVTTSDKRPTRHPEDLNISIRRYSNTSVPEHIQIQTQTTYRRSQKCIPCHRCKSMNDSLVGIIKPSSYPQNASQPSAASNRAKHHALRGANKLKDSLQLKRYQSFKNKQLLENILIDGVEPTASTGTAVHEAFFTDSWLPSCVTFSMSMKVFIQLNADLYISVVKTL